MIFYNFNDFIIKMSQRKQRTLIILKPEVLERNIIGKILSYWDGHRFKLVASKVLTGSDKQFREHYEDVLERITPEIGDGIIKRMTRGDCIFLVYEGDNIIRETREFVGSTDPTKANKNTIRAMYGESISYNVVHASDSDENADKEIKLWFPELN